MTAAIPFPDLSPELISIQLFGFTLALRWYALAYIVGLLIAWRLAVTAVRRDALWPGGNAPMKPAQVEDLLTWLILGVILGGRLGFVLFYQPGYYLQNPGEILRIWQGGMAFHGGLIGVVLAFQGAAQLRQFGAEVFVVELIAISVLRELGILLTAIIVAGRSGSAFTASIGSMKVQEELDAMRERLNALRTGFSSALVRATNNDAYASLANQAGMFSVLKFREGGIADLQKEEGIYIPGSGRTNIAGLPEDRLDEIATRIAPYLSPAG